MDPKSLSQSKRRRLQKNSRFTILKQNQLLSIANVRPSNFQPQGFTIDFSDGTDPWRLIPQTSNSYLLKNLLSNTQRLFPSISSPSSSLDNHLQNAELERVVIDLP